MKSFEEFTVSLLPMCTTKDNQPECLQMVL